MQKRIAIAGIALSLMASGGTALALQNPIVSQLHPVGNSRVTGNVTFMQLGADVNVGVDLEKDVTNAAVDVRRGSCSSYASNAKFPLVSVNGTTQSTRLGHVSLQQLVGNVIVIHKTRADNSPVVACGEIKG
jgi:hypothetical protein